MRRKRSKKQVNDPVSFRLSRDARANLVRLRKQWGWSGTVAVEMALAFANNNREFSPLLCQPKAEVGA